MEYAHVEEDYRFIRESIEHTLKQSGNGNILDAICFQQNCIQFKYDGFDFQLQARHNENPWELTLSSPEYHNIEQCKDKISSLLKNWVPSYNRDLEWTISNVHIKDVPEIMANTLITLLSK